MRILAALFLVLIFALPCWASDVGVFVRSDPTTISSPVSGKTVCYDTTKGIWCVYDSTIPGYRSIGVAKTNLNATVAPTANDDNTEGYAPGSLWVNPTDQFMYMCLSAATGAAVWDEFDNTYIGDRVSEGVGPLLTTAEVFTDWIPFGGLNLDPITPSTLTQDLNAGFVTIGGAHVAYPGETITFLANKDYYGYLPQIGGPLVWAYVNNGDSPPSNPIVSPAFGELVIKVVTGASSVTSATLQMPTLPNAFINAGTNVSHAVNVGQLCPEPYVVPSFPYQIAVNQAFIICNLTGDGTLNLPDGTQRCLVTVKLSAGGHTLTVEQSTAVTGQTINGNPTFTATTDGTYQFISDGFGNFTSF